MRRISIHLPKSVLRCGMLLFVIGILITSCSKEDEPKTIKYEISCQDPTMPIAVRDLVDMPLGVVFLDKWDYTFYTNDEYVSFIAEAYNSMQYPGNVILPLITGKIYVNGKLVQNLSGNGYLNMRYDFSDE